MTVTFARPSTKSSGRMTPSRHGPRCNRGPSGRGVSARALRRIGTPCPSTPWPRQHLHGSSPPTGTSLGGNCQRGRRPRVALRRTPARPGPERKEPSDGAYPIIVVLNALMTATGRHLAPVEYPMAGSVAYRWVAGTNAMDCTAWESA
jgi:hypothetical protein